QLKTTQLKESFIITQDIIEYEDEEGKEKVHLSEITPLSDAQRMHDKLHYFFEDLQRLNTTSQGIDNLLESQYMTPSVLLRLYEDDFMLLLNKANAIRDQEVQNFLNPVTKLLGSNYRKR
ncbi:17382_t:CDS:2, partial [Gigaspora rosea]